MSNNHQTLTREEVNPNDPQCETKVGRKGTLPALNRKILVFTGYQSLEDEGLEVEYLE